jgi:hypothetical protein
MQKYRVSGPYTVTVFQDGINYGYSRTNQIDVVVAADDEDDAKSIAVGNDLAMRYEDCEIDDEDWRQLAVSPIDDASPEREQDAAAVERMMRIEGMPTLFD